EIDGPALARLEEGIFAHFDVGALVARHVDEPRAGARKSRLAHREHDLLSELDVRGLLEQRLEVLEISQALLPKPEDRLAANVLGHAVAFRRAAEGLTCALAALLREREDRLLPQLVVARREQHGVERRNGFL